MPKQSKTTLYRFLEIFPALLTWLTFAGAIVFSYFVPFLVAIYIILFDLYWVLKAVNTAMHLFSSFSKLGLHANHDWRKRMESLADLEGYKKQLRKEILEASSRKNVVDLKHELFRLNKIDFTDRALDPRQIYHLVLLPTYKESLTVLESSVRSIASSNFPKEQIFFALATEERDRDLALENSRILRERYSDKFLRFEVFMHPDGIEGEIKAKGANLTYAARRAVAIFREELKIPMENIIVSAFDSDTVVSKDYFSYL